MGRKPLNLTKQRSGRLTAIRKIGKLGLYYVWECQCDCGKTLPVETRKWQRLHSCGCLTKERNKNTSDRATIRRNEILELRDKLGLSQNQIAARLKLSRQMVSKILRRAR